MDLKDKFKGTLYVIGTPAEEENGAKIGMAEQGIFDDMSMAVMKLNSLEKPLMQLLLHGMAKVPSPLQENFLI